METILHFDDDVRSFYATDTTRIPAQKVHNYRSDRWIALKFFSLVFGGCFTLRSMDSILHADDVRSGPTTDTTRVPTQKVHNYRSDRWIALNVFFTSLRRLFYIEKRGIGTAGRRCPVGPCHQYARVPAQKVHNYRSDRWIALNFFH